MLIMLIKIAVIVLHILVILIAHSCFVRTNLHLSLPNFSMLWICSGFMNLLFYYLIHTTGSD